MSLSEYLPNEREIRTRALVLKDGSYASGADFYANVARDVEALLRAAEMACADGSERFAELEADNEELLERIKVLEAEQERTVEERDELFAKVRGFEERERETVEDARQGISKGVLDGGINAYEALTRILNRHG